MTNYQLYVKSGVPKSTIGNLVNSTYARIAQEIEPKAKIDWQQATAR